MDEMTLAVNDLQEEFEENDSELETVARESFHRSGAIRFQRNKNRVAKSGFAFSLF